MGGDPFSLLLDQRIIFLGGEVRVWRAEGGPTPPHALQVPILSPFLSHLFSLSLSRKVNDFVADAIISQMLLLDAKDPTKVRGNSDEG
jgi:hypothetical protein